MLHKLTKFAFFFSLFLTIYFFTAVIVLPYFADPRLSGYVDYHRLYNWDLKHHSWDKDFDGDSKPDMISFTGCAFFSAADISKIPEDRRCQATGISEINAQGQDRSVGQKYIISSKSDLNLTLNTGVTHSYLFKTKDSENWHIFVNSQDTQKIFTIGSNGLLKEMEEPIPLTTKIDEQLYLLSRFFFILAYPLLPLFIIFEVLYGGLKPVASVDMSYEILTLVGITTVLGLLVYKNKKAEKK